MSRQLRRTIALPLTNAEGVIVIPETPVPLGVNEARWKLPRAGLLNLSVRFECRLEISYDDRLTWHPGGAWTAEGGEITDRKRGGIAQWTMGDCTWPEVNNPRRYVRGTLTITGGQATAAGALELAEMS